MSAITVTLPETLQAFVDEQVKLGGYETSSEYVRALLRKEQDRQQLRALLLAGVGSPAGAPVDDAYFGELRQRVRGPAPR